MGFLSKVRPKRAFSFGRACLPLEATAGMLIHDHQQGFFANPNRRKPVVLVREASAPAPLAETIPSLSNLDRRGDAPADPDEDRAALL